MNLTYGETLPMVLIKREKYRSNQKIKFPRDTRKRRREITINNGWNKQIFQILCEKPDVNFLFKGNFLVRLPKPVELQH